MFDRAGIVLKRGKDVCLRGISSISRVVRKRDVGQLQRRSYFPEVAAGSAESCDGSLRLCDKTYNDEEAERNENKKEIGFPHLPQILHSHVAELQDLFAPVVPHKLLRLVSRLNRHKLRAHRSVHVAFLDEEQPPGIHHLR